VAARLSTGERNLPVGAGETVLLPQVFLDVSKRPHLLREPRIDGRRGLVSERNGVLPVLLHEANEVGAVCTRSFLGGVVNT